MLFQHKAMKAQRRAINGFLLATVLACALFADLGHSAQSSRPGLRASLSGSSGGACSAGLPDGRSFITGGRARGGPLASTAYFETDGRLTPAAPMLAPRADHVCVALEDGTVLGSDSTSRLSASSKLETTHMYVEADLANEAACLGKICTCQNQTARFRANDTLLAFLSTL